MRVQLTEGLLLIPRMWALYQVLGQSAQLQEEYRSLELYLPLLGLMMANKLDISALLGSDKGVP